MPENRLLNVVRALNAFEASLSPTLPVDMAAFVNGRVDLARAVNAFLAGEREGLSDPLQTLVRDVVRADQQALYKAFADIRIRYSAHIAKWDNRTVTASWPAYRNDCMALVTGMRALLQRRARASGLAAA